MERPWVFLNMASSIDGKITTYRRERFKLGGAEDRALMEALRARADAVLIGKGTLHDEDPCLVLTRPEAIAERQRLKGNAQPVNALASATLDFPVEGSRFFGCEATEKIVFTTERAEPAKRHLLERYATVAVVPATPEGQVDLKRMAGMMPAYGIRHLLLEGGGILNFSMLEADLIDEIYLTLCPLVIGGGQAPTTFAGRGFTQEAVRRLTLQSARPHACGEIFLHYTVNRPAATP